MVRNDKFSLLYKKYNKHILNVCKRYSSNVDDAHDLMQETFMKIHGVIDKIDVDNCKTYITRIARNNAIDTIRKNKGMLLSSIDSDSSTYLEVEYMTHTSCCYEGDDFTSHVRSNSDKLGGKHSDIFNMFVFDGMQHKDIAEKLSMNISTVRGDLFKSRKKIKEMVEFN